MTDTAWLYRLISTLDDLAQVSSVALEPDQDALASATGWADLMDRLRDAIGDANEAGSDVPNIREWIDGIRKEGDDGTL